MRKSLATSDQSERKTRFVSFFLILVLVFSPPISYADEGVYASAQDEEEPATSQSSVYKPSTIRRPAAPKPPVIARRRPPAPMIVSKSTTPPVPKKEVPLVTVDPESEPLPAPPKIVAKPVEREPLPSGPEEEMPMKEISEPLKREPAPRVEEEEAPPPPPKPLTRKAPERKRITPRAKKEPKERNLYVEEFFMSPDLRLQYETMDVDGFVFVKTPSLQWDTKYSIVTGFDQNVLKTRYVRGVHSAKDAQAWIDATLKTAEFESVEIRQLTLPGRKEGDQSKTLYWVGHRSFESADEASSQLALIKSIVESQGKDFTAMIADARRYVRLPEKEAPVEIKSPAQYAREEAIALKWLDQMDFGEQMFGPFQGSPSGEPVVWQSFGETSWRNTNFESKHFNNQVAFWTNRLSFKGIRFPINTLNPYVEETTSIEAVGTEFKSNLKFYAGLEWRPLERNAFFNNYRPWGLPLLIWMKNWRMFVQYGNRYNLKGEIDNSDNHDLEWGLQIFYEWGIDLPSLSEQGLTDNIPDFLRKYSWGEFFGDYKVKMTDFGSRDDYDAMGFDTSLILGFRLPGVPLPHNPINDEFVLMPYLKLGHTWNTRYSDPASNKLFVGAGIRWMPFRTYKFKESEWLTKFKVFFEYDGIGKVQHFRQDEEAPFAVREDFRLGVAISSRRF